MEKKILLHSEFTFDSAHFLRNYEGKCKNVHGHSWFVEVWIKGNIYQIDERGILFDFTNVKEIKEYFDHKLLNDLSEFEDINPTAENICLVIFNRLKIINNSLDYRVRVYENRIEKYNYCEYGDFGDF